MTPTRCFLQIRGRWYALMNWKVRLSGADAVVLRALSCEEETSFHALKRNGVEEAAIFDRLYPPQRAPAPVQEVWLPIALLTKAQLAYLIESRLRTPLPSLAKMRKDDLMMLLSRL